MSTSASPASLRVGAAGPPPQSTSGARTAPAAVLLGTVNALTALLLERVPAERAGVAGGALNAAPGSAVPWPSPSSAR